MRPDYASDEVVARIRKWNVTDGSWHALLVFMDDNWPEYGCVRHVGKRWEFVTGGFSGCEEIIEAFLDNYIAMSMLWESSHRGGKHVLVEP